MNRSTFLTTIFASVVALFGFKKKPISRTVDMGNGYVVKATKTGPDTWRYYKSHDHGNTWVDSGEIEFGEMMPGNYSNEPIKIDLSTAHKDIEFSVVDWDRRKFVVQRSEDGCKTWKTVREYDLKDMRT